MQCIAILHVNRLGHYQLPSSLRLYYPFQVLGTPVAINPTSDQCEALYPYPVDSGSLVLYPAIEIQQSN